jgi:A/G-specific adenine glycosylase
VPPITRQSTRDRAVSDALLEWFAAEGRDWPWRRTRDRWVVLVSEVCLQQTQVARAAGHVERILAAYPTACDLAVAPLGELLALWQGLGYPRRARNLWLAAQHIARHGWPDDYTDLPGVGPYTAAALRCFADEQPVVPPDINTRRVQARLFPNGTPQPDDAWSWGQAIMELGQVHCRARASCDTCPVTTLCPSSGTDEVIASPRQKRYEGSMRQRRGTLLKALTTDGEVAIDIDPEAAATLVADGLASDSGTGMLLPPTGHDT